ncbi:hypothetical protein M413DRAFT_345000 [Hebeloma cylindrosporum]|uniref:Uncharacterized protein n=1 Tax=Hebeloma cylindrosporum TaxID=76867 RepID=A0A0C3CNK6_HEBCY|nr:hypothetical protein M413DRAFT_345000 [Hebeloma cylindrosporum h7]
MAVRPLFEGAMSPTSTGGLPSPNPSYLSLPDSSSFFSSSSASSSYHAPRTPLRSPRTPRPSPLFRLLQPFVLKAPPNTPTSTSPTTDTSPFMVLHHPTPQSYQPPSPTNTTAPRPPTPSRSERLLRDALMRDELERHPVPSSPLVPPSPSSKTHRRRHSHVPTSTAVAGRAHAPSSPERDREESMRGAFLFRTAMNNPRSSSPGLPPATERESKRYYGGDAERSASPTPTTPQQGHHHISQSHQSQQQLHHQPPPSQPHFNARSTTRSTQSPSARSTSHSPSPLRHRRQAGGSLSLNRPLPLPLDNDSPSRRARSPMNPRHQNQQGLPTSPGEPLVMTPHEQVLRARLERVLSAGRVMEKGEKEKEVERQRQIIRQRERRNRERSESRGNEVRDEEGGWPWREHERDRDRGVWGVEETATTTSPLYSSASNNSGSSGVLPTLQSIRSTATTSTPTRVPHNRTRSKTDPHSPSPRTAVVSSPRRGSTAPTPSRIPVTKSTASAVSQRTGTTPPLVSGQADNGHEADADDGDDDDDGDLRLLTPPPTPPFTTRMFSFSLGGGGETPYLPSPYKTNNSPATSRTGAGSVGQTVGRRKSDANSKVDGKNPTKKAGLVLGSPRRPRNAPVRNMHSSSSDIEHAHDNDDGAADASCSSSGRSSSNSQASFPASDDLSHHLRAPHSPTAQHLSHPQRPQFNARTASARCRAIEGYVSFASVEGLGEPPADPMSPDGVVEDEDGVKTGSVLGLGAGVAGWGGWRRLLGVAGVVGTPHEDGQQQRGVVL